MCIHEKKIHIFMNKKIKIYCLFCFYSAWYILKDEMYISIVKSKNLRVKKLRV